MSFRNIFYINLREYSIYKLNGLYIWSYKLNALLFILTALFNTSSVKNYPESQKPSDSTFYVSFIINNSVLNIY